MQHVQSFWSMFYGQLARSDSLRYSGYHRRWGSPLSAFGLMTPIGRKGLESYSSHRRPAGALMERLPEPLSIALWIVGACWALAIIGYAFGAPSEWIFPVFLLGLITGVAEWVLRRQSKG